MSCKADVCPCKNTGCPRFGKCCECVNAHKTSDYLPACLRHFQENNK